MTPQNDDGIYLAFCQVREHRSLDILLTGLVELGISQAWVADVRGIGDVLSVDVPVFAGLSVLFPTSGGEGHMVFCVFPGGLLAELREMVAELRDPAAGDPAMVFMALPLAGYEGPDPMFEG